MAYDLGHRMRMVAYDGDDPNGSPTGEIDDAVEASMEWQIRYNAPGAASFKINRHSSNRTITQPDAYVRCYLDDTGSEPVFAFWITESSDVVLAPGEDGAEVMTKNGEGAMSYMADGIVWYEAVTTNDAAAPGDNDDMWHWTLAMGAHPAGVLVRMIEEAVARGCYPDLTYDFTRTTDSNGDPWTVTLDDFQLQVGTDLLTVMGYLQTMGLVFVMDHDLTLHAYEATSYGNDLSASVTFEKGVDIMATADRHQVSSPARSTVLVKGARSDTGETAWVEADSVAGLAETKRRKEGFFDAQETTHFDTLQAIGLEEIYQKLRLKAGPTNLVVLPLDTQAPIADYNVGDIVTVNVTGIWNDEPKTITYIGFTQTAADEYDVAVGFEDAPSMRSLATLVNPGPPALQTQTCCPHEGPFVPPGAGEDCGLAAEATLSIGSHAYLGDPGPADINYAYGSAQGATVALTNGLQYRVVATVVSNLVGPLGDMASPPTVTLRDALGGSSGPTPGPNGLDLNAGGEWELAAVTSTGIGTTGYVAGFDPYQAGDQFISDWKNYVGSSLTADIVASGNPSSIYGFLWTANVRVEVRNGDGSVIDCGDGTTQTYPHDGQSTQELAGGTGTTRFTNFPYLPGSLHVWVGGVRVIVTETDPTTGEFELPFDPGASPVVIEYQGTSDHTSTGAGNPQPVPGTVPIPPVLLPDDNPSWVIDANSATYGATGDGSTDDTAARQAAIDAAYAAAVAASSPIAIVEYAAGIYLHSGSLVTTGHFYAQVTLPERAGTASKILLIERAKVRSGVGLPGGSQSTTQLGNVIFKSTLTGGTYSGTHGWPSITGGPDPQKTANFSNIAYHSQGISYRAPNNPSLCALNLQRVNQAIVEDAFFDTADTIAGGITQPTHATGVAVLMPGEANNAIAEYRGNIWAIGWYAGAGISEHTRADTLTAYRCAVGMNVQGDYYHAADIDQLITEHCTYSIATVDSTGIANPSGASGFAAFNIGTWTIEDATSTWAAPTYHINDPGNDYRGRARVVRVVAGTGDASPQTLTLNGATGYGIDYILDGAGGSGAPTGADYLVGTANGSLSAEIVVGTTPGGELGGTWASPTVDATHAGSTHVALSSATPLIESGSGSAGSGTAASKDDHVHPAASSSGGSELVISDTPSTPLIFDDILQNEAQDDLIYAD